MSDSFPLPYNDSDLTGQVALVTGATAGLGRRFALVLAKCGAKVALAGRREERLAEVAAEIEAFGGESCQVPLDMTDQAAVVDAVEQVEQQLGLITILVNNAGIPDAQRAHRMKLDLINRVFDTNLVGPYILSCEVAKRLIATEQPGRMVNIASVGAFRYDGNGAALYSITKAGMVRMTEALAVEWSRFNINVNCIAPGAFSSEMMDGMIERVGDISANFPRKRMGQPAQLDSTLLYLCAPASECVTGAVIKVSDGQGAM
ncbi:MAG: short-chain dehydrogenase [Gammaproteobacteria bacterium]|nr:short-chain dehydrogenase [Gammaproteobacteria bacterium]|tara:strand:+ start:297 stop:1076 length:780 start_codon:yes stop_codon:yes gene_type:complete